MDRGRAMSDSVGGHPAPRVLGPWTLLEQVGSGGMGVVYRATRPDLGDRVVALKVIRPGLLDDQAVQARFAREVEVLRRVRDVHISEFIDADLAGEPAWLATAFIEGPNVRDYVAAHGPLPRERWWELARGLSQALAVLEVHGITHRDIKPANVILSPSGAVLIDFGIAVPEDAASLTGTGLVTGSPAWLSPEQANLQPVTPASDIFSLGSLLAFAGTGRTPFGTGPNVAMLLAIATKEPDLAGLDPDQAQLLSEMMAKDPAQRLSARQVLQRCKIALARGPQRAAETLEADPHAPTQVIPVAAPERIAVAPSRGAEPSAMPQERRRSPWLLPLGLIAAAFLVVLGYLMWPLGGDNAAEPTPAATTTPTASPPGGGGPTPPPPAPGEVARSGDFVLSPWRIENEADGTMSVSATVKNSGAAPASGYATVFIYSDGRPIGSAGGPLPVIPPGGSVQVTLEGADRWQPGEKSVTLVVDPM